MDVVLMCVDYVGWLGMNKGLHFISQVWILKNKYHKIYYIYAWILDASQYW